MSKTTILLAEDSADDVFFFRRGLQKTGLNAEIKVVENGQEAIDYLTQQNGYAEPMMSPRPDVIFIDLKMPEVDGFELLEWISKNYATPPFEAIVLTSSDEPRDYKKALDLGAHGYFLKPITSEQLSTILTRQRVAPA
jgi:CheY-like chemotaxis protein